MVYCCYTEVWGGYVHKYDSEHNQMVRITSEIYLNCMHLILVSGVWQKPDF